MYQVTITIKCYEFVALQHDASKMQIYDPTHIGLQLIILQII